MKAFSFARLARFSNFLVFSVSILVICGYIFDVQVLMSLSPKLTAMNPATAIFLMLCSIWVEIYSWRSYSPVSAFVLVIIPSLLLLAGIEKLLEIAGVSHIYYDRWFFANTLRQRNQFNAIAPNAALLFCFAGLIMFNAKNKRAWGRLANDALRLTGFVIAYFGMLGYIYSIKPAYTVGPFVPMALNTAMCFAAFFFTCFLCLPQGHFSRVIGSPFLGGRITRRGVPVLLLIPILFGYFRIWGEERGFYDAANGIALYTVFIVLLMFVLLYVYANNLNKKDIAEKESLVKIAESEEKYRTLFQTMREGVWYLNKQGSIMFCNRALCNITGFEEYELANINISDILISDDSSFSFIEKLYNLPFGRQDEYEVQIKHKNGNPIWASVASRVLYDVKGAITASFSTVSDITERKKQAEDLEAFTASAAHDLSSPLARIEMIMDLLINNDTGNFSFDDLILIQAASNTSTEMRSMLQGLLQFSKLGSAQITRTDVDINKQVQSILEVNQHLNPKAKIIVAQLPPANADEQALKHVMGNLLTNALKYSSRKEQPVVEVGFIEENERQIFFVKDNGEGFDIQKASKLFSPFQRFHSNFEGNGLGLPIAKRIIEKHGGRIWAESEKGKGSSFYFTLS